MGEQLNFFALLSLKEMALRRTAVLLWNDPDVLSSILRIDCAVPYHTAEDRVRVKVSLLGLPKSLTKELVGVVRPVGLEMRRWKKFHNERFGVINFNANDSPGSTKLCWTTAGRIDYRKTVKELLCNALGVEQRYLIACDYCLEDSIALLWEELPEGAKEFFGDEDNICCGLSFQWPHILRGEQSKLDDWSREESELNFNQFSFECSARLANMCAADYFFQKLTPEERQDSLLRSLHALMEAIEEEGDFYDSPSETFRYLLTLLSPEVGMETLRGHPIPFFLCFFDMVWPDLFLENVALVWKNLPPSHYTRLLQVMVEKYEWKDHYFPELFREFLTQSPPDFKKRFVGQESESEDSPACSFLSAFFDHEDSESVAALFRSLGVDDRKQLVFHRCVLQLLFRSVFDDDQWPMVELCLREAALSTAEKEGLKKHFAGTFEKSYPGFDCRANPKLKSVFDFLDAPDAGVDDERRGQKRKREDCFVEL